MRRPHLSADITVQKEEVPPGPRVGPERTGLSAFLLGNRRRGEGLTASWWAVGALSGFIAAIGGLAKGMWWAAAFLVPAVILAVVAVQRAREGNY